MSQNLCYNERAVRERADRIGIYHRILTGKAGKDMKNLNVGILAHVDAGKTTLSESMLYVSGSIRKMGRVDHQDAFLDTYDLEKDRGITIFSKQAVLQYEDCRITLLDTPGHVDFSSEMERTLQVLDYAILVISGADGVQGHTQTLWRLLKRYEIPVFLFVNKMDQEGTDRACLMRELKAKLDEGCIDFGQDPDSWMEELAMTEERMLEEFLEKGSIPEEKIPKLIQDRVVFPCYFGSALRVTGVEEFLQGIRRYAREKNYPDAFGAKVYKIARDDCRLTYLKVTGGSLKVKMLLTNRRENQEDSREVWEEKVDQIRIYSGAKYEMVKEAKAGTVCAVTGLNDTYPGQGLGIEKDSASPVLESVLNYQILLPEDCDPYRTFGKLKELEEEDPQLHLVWNERLGEIHANVMGEVQIEVLKTLIWERFGIAVNFGTGNIVYKETIEEPVEGVGHFEPLRHYAEVHLLLEPQERGTGLVFDTACSEDRLARNWQRLILTHLAEKEHLGVLTGSAITDMKITLVSGKAHTKHTEGGDFRQATYRAVRQGLRKAKSILLEPYYEFSLEVPAENVGRAMSDIQRMNGSFQPPVPEGEMTCLTGEVPVSAMQNYQREVVSYTKGRGRLSCVLKGYQPCHNQEEIVAQIGYDPDGDPDHPTGSVFCAHGAGFVVPWDEVEAYMHLENHLEEERDSYEEDLMEIRQRKAAADPGRAKFGADTEELEAIFERTYGPVKRKKAPPKQQRITGDAGRSERPERKKAGPEKEKEYLLVDGYNIIFAWEDLNDLAKVSIDGARMKLMDILSNYQGFRNCTLILVFDAYKVEGHRCEITKYHNIYVVYTAEAETADQYIEKTVHEIGRKYHVTVATSDGLEQVIIRGQGAALLSARELREEIELAREEIRQEAEQKRQKGRQYLFDHLEEDLADYVEDVRLGRRELE